MGGTRGRADWSVELWRGTFSTVHESGWYWEDRDFTWEKKRGRFRDWDAHGVERIPGVGIVLQHKMVPRHACRFDEQGAPSNVIPTEWEVGSGEWAVTQPAGSTVNTLWQGSKPTAADAATERWAIAQKVRPRYGGGFRESRPDPLWFKANPHFAVGIMRAATPEKPKEVDKADLPVYYTEVRFGGQWAVRFEKWGKPRLMKHYGARWFPVKELGFDMSDLYKDEGTEGYQDLEVLTLDGAIILRFGGPGAAYEVYRDDDTANGLPSMPLGFAGNGGAAGFRVQEILFNTGLLNYLQTRKTVSIPYVCDAAHYLAYFERWAASTNLDLGPDGIADTLDDVRHVQILKSRGDGDDVTFPTVYAIGEELNGEYHWGERSQFHLAVRLWDSTGADTPVLKYVYAKLAARVTVNVPAWTDVSSDVLDVQGSWEFDLDSWQIRGDYDLVLSNRPDARTMNYSEWGEQVWRVRIKLGNQTVPGGNVHLPALRLCGRAYVDSADRDLLTQSVVKVRCTCMMGDLEDDKCDGMMPDYADMKVVDAVRDVLLRHGIPAAHLGTLYDSGWKVPSKHIWTEDDKQREEEAGYRPAEGTSFVEILEQLRKYEYRVMFFFDAAGRFNWMQYPATSAAVAFPAKYGDDQFHAMRKVQRAGGQRMQANYVRITGKDRLTGEPLVGVKEDRASITDPAAANFLGRRKPVFDVDETLNEQRFVDIRLREVYEDKARARIKALFENWADSSLFPFVQMDPVSLILTAWHGFLQEDMGIVGDQTYWCTSVEDELDVSELVYQQSYNFARWVVPV